MAKRSKTQKAVRNKGKEKINSKKIGLLTAILFILILVGIVGMNLMFLFKVSQTDVSLEGLLENGATIYDGDGEVYTKLNIKNCATWIPIKDIPDEVKGVDTEIGKSYAQLIIEQFYPNEKEQNVLIKVLEQNYEPEVLTEFYLNTVYLGDGVYGLGSAAKRFKGCAYDELPDRTVFKDIMVSYFETLNYENVNTIIRENSMIYEENGYVDGVIKETAQKLQEMGMDEKAAYDAIFTGNLHIYTYLDTGIQETIEAAYLEKAVFSEDASDANYIQSAMILMDTEGNIKAVASGNDGDKVLNRAIGKNYKAASTIKPITSYALGIEMDAIHFSALIPDEQMFINNAQEEFIAWPSNSDGEYGGMITVNQALQKSKNTVAVQIGQRIGEETMFGFLTNQLGYDLVSYENGSTDVQLSALCLGYFKKGISLSKLTASYELFVSQGMFYDSSMIQEIKDETGKALFVDQREAVQAISEETAYIMNRLLHNTIYGEDSIAKSAAIEGVEVIGKTGTIGDDAGHTTARLFVGATSDYIASVWIGYDDALSLSLRIYNDPDEIFSNVMSRLPHSKEEWEMPKNVVEQEYCLNSGLLAGDGCRETELGYYDMDHMPVVCDSCFD